MLGVFLTDDPLAVPPLGRDRPLAEVGEAEIGTALAALWGESAPATWNRNRAAITSCSNAGTSPRPRALFDRVVVRPVNGRVVAVGSSWPQGQTHLRMIRRALARLAISSERVWCSCATHAG
jgi:hypothetical protein